jgi:2-(3-amino-3-carboxypropyl)histidine synthase
VSYKRYAQGLIHFGHSPIPSMGEDPDVLYIEACAEVGIEDALSPQISALPQRVGLLASVQYVHLLDRAKEMIEATGRTAVIGKGDLRIFYPGQVLGCNCSSGLSVQGEVDGFLFIGEGNFHPLAAAFGLKKPMTVLNPITGEARYVETVTDTSTLADNWCMRAIITYVKMNFGNPPNQEWLQQSYETQLGQLMTTSGYTNFGDDDSVATE